MPPPKRRLTLEDVCDAAENLANKRALTLTELAAVLEIRPPSLYTHIDSLEALQRLLSMRCYAQLSELAQQAALGKSQDEAVHAVARAVRTYVRQRPGLYQSYIANTPQDRDAEWIQAGERLGNVFRGILAGYNLGETDTVHAMRGLRSLIHGFVMLELGGSFKQRVNRDESFDRLLDFFVRGLRAQQKA